MRLIETCAWLVLAFTDGSECLLQGSFHWLPQGRAFVREDTCAVQSQQEGGYVVFWSDNRWVAIKIPTGARSLSYRWGRAVAFVNGDSVKVQHGKILGELPRACHPFRNGERAISKSMEAPPESSSRRNASLEVRQGFTRHISVFLRVLAHIHPFRAVGSPETLEQLAIDRGVWRGYDRATTW